MGVPSIAFFKCYPLAAFRQKQSNTLFQVLGVHGPEDAFAINHHCRGVARDMISPAIRHDILDFCVRELDTYGKGGGSTIIPLLQQ